MNFWETLQQVVDDSAIKIDRPKDTAHPRYPDYIYPFDYGYLEGTTSGDGDGIDCWVGSLSGKNVTGVVTIVDQIKKDSEIKILLGCTQEDMQAILVCHQRGSMSGLLTIRS
jgi:inorganic pyrophosphatase